MTTIQVLGPGCSNCVRTAQLIRKVADELGIRVDVEKEADLGALLGHGALSTPGVVIDEKLVHAGGVPSVAQIRAWLEAL